MSLTRKALAVVGAVALCVAALGLGYVVRAALPGLGSPAAFAQITTGTTTPETEDATDGTVDATDETVDTTGEAVEASTTVAPAEIALPEAVGKMYMVGRIARGKLMIGESEILRTVYARNGVEPYVRATTAAARINLALQEGAQPEDFQAAEEAEGEWIVVANDRVIIGVAPGEPNVYKLGQQRLCEKWASNIAMALHEAMGTKPGQETPLPPLVAEAKVVTIGGQQGAALVVNGVEVLAVSSQAAGLAPFDRLDIVATRLQQAVAEGALPQGTDAGLLARDVPHRPEPQPQRFVRVLEDRASDHRRLVPAPGTMQQITAGPPRLEVATSRAVEPLGPAQSQ